MSIRVATAFGNVSKLCIIFIHIGIKATTAYIFMIHAIGQNCMAIYYYLYISYKIFFLMSSIIQ